MDKPNPPATEDLRADALLAVRCQLGERAAFDDLIQRWAMPLRRYVGRVVGNADAADELMQDIWLRLIQGIGRLKDPARLRAWLFGIAHRRVMDFLRERYAASSIVDVDTDTLVDEEPNFDRELEAGELERGLQGLPPVEREVLSLFYLDELPLAEVAQVLGLPSGTVKSRLFRARNLLRQQLIGDRHE
jgi:RNA polymerase sigma-70 factor (ECF subfamily)